MKVNDIYETNGYGRLKIVNYINARNVVIKFIDTGLVKTVEAGNIRRGGVKDQLMPSVKGVGFIGIGNHKESDKAYSHWSKMLKRCYDENWRKEHPTYKDCSTCTEWHDYQVFAEWFLDNYDNNLKYPSLDKDILIKGNKLYSPMTCLIVEMSENIAERNKNLTRK